MRKSNIPYLIIAIFVMAIPNAQAAQYQTIDVYETCLTDDFFVRAWKDQACLQDGKDSQTCRQLTALKLEPCDQMSDEYFKENNRTFDASKAREFLSALRKSLACGKENYGGKSVSTYLEETQDILKNNKVVRYWRDQIECIQSFKHDNRLRKLCFGPEKKGSGCKTLNVSDVSPKAAADNPHGSSP